MGYRPTFGDRIDLAIIAGYGKTREEVIAYRAAMVEAGDEDAVRDLDNVYGFALASQRASISTPPNGARFMTEDDIYPPPPGFRSPYGYSNLDQED